MLKRSALALLCLSACVVDGDDVAIDDETAAITDGVIRSARENGVGLFTTSGKTCSVTFVENDVALTSHACAAKKGRVDVSGVSADVRVFRSIGGSGNVVAVQLRKRLPLAKAGGVSTSGYQRGIDPVPLKPGDRVTCLGFSGGQMRTGIFMVADSSSDTQIFLRGASSANGPPYAATVEDVGGYCQRDGTNIAALILQETDGNGITLAEPLHKLGPNLQTLAFVSDVARTYGAVRLRDPAGATFLTTADTGDRVTTEPLAADLADRRQAFYLETVATPPGHAGAGWVRAISVYDGRCLTAAKPDVKQDTCISGRLDQTFYLGYQQIGGFDRYRLIADTNSVQVNGAGNKVSLTPTLAAQANQQLEMWLTPY
jgi:hypothetical protein